MQMVSRSVSVVLCTYNGARYLDQQLQSILEQTSPPDEVVVGDDRSDDDTLAKLNAFREQAPFDVSVIINAQRLGSSRNFERSLQRSKMDLVAMCDQDDVWLPHKLATLADALERGGGAFAAFAAFSDALLIGEHDEPIPGSLWEQLGVDARELRGLRSDRAAVRLARRGIITGATMMIRREVIDWGTPVETAGGRFVHDGWLAAVAAVAGPIVAVRQPLIHYRSHPSQQIGLRPRNPAKRRSPTWSRLRQAPRGASIHDFEINVLALLSSRSEIIPTAWAVQQRRIVDKTRRHLLKRSSLPTSAPGRARAVAGMVCKGDYWRYSESPLRAPVRDLLLG